MEPVWPKYSNGVLCHGLLRWSLQPNITSVARLLAYVTGLVNQELLPKNEYLLAENRILKTHVQPGFRLSRPERTTLAEIGKRLGRRLLPQVASIAHPDTILGWYRKNWSLPSSLAPDSVGCPAGCRSTRRSRLWWFGWRERIPAGATTGSWEHWPTWGIR
jgi:hypothetical protein